MKKETYDFIWGFLWCAKKKCRQSEDAEDILQEVIININKRAKWFEALATCEKVGYVQRSIHNQYVSMVRYKNSKRRDIDPYLIPTKTDPEVYAKIELKDKLEKARLKPVVCRSLLLFIQGYSLKEIAALEGQKINTISGRFRYAKKFLRA